MWRGTCGRSRKQVGALCVAFYYGAAFVFDRRRR